MAVIKVANVTLPNEPLGNLELGSAVRKLRIASFRGVFLRDALPKKPKGKECGILNRDDFDGPGTHWVAWHKNESKKYYFDSFGLRPPTELVDYLKSPIFYNTERLQGSGQTFCVHLCLHVLKLLSRGKGFQEIINSLH